MEKQIAINKDNDVEIIITDYEYLMWAKFTVAPQDARKAWKALGRAASNYWDNEDAAQETPGDWLRYALDDAGISYRHDIRVFNDEDDEDDDAEFPWNSMPSKEVQKVLRKAERRKA